MTVDSTMRRVYDMLLMNPLFPAIAKQLKG